jgi:hypothetical protein
VSDDRAIAVLQRWIASGGHWEVLAESADQVTVGLYTCDGGEVMDRVTLPTAALPKNG